MCGFWLLAAWGGDSFSQWPLREVAMARDGLFEDLPEQPGPERAAGRARLREPERDQIELRAVALDRLLGAAHPARVIWAYLAPLDLRALVAAVRARQPPAVQDVGRAAVREEMCSQVLILVLG